MEYAIKVSVINEDGDEETCEIVRSTSYEQAAEALARVIKHHESKVANQPLEDNE